MNRGRGGIEFLIFGKKRYKAQKPLVLLINSYEIVKLA
jgi:hypothetical protein